MDLDEIRKLYETTTTSNRKIAELSGLSKDQIARLARRHSWVKPPRTLFDRLDALHAEMDRVLRENPVRYYRLSPPRS